MSVRGSRWFTPAQVFAQFSSANEKDSRDPTSPEGKQGNQRNENETTEVHKRREIQITETGEVSLPPDKARVCIVCSNTKVRGFRNQSLVAYEILE